MTRSARILVSALGLLAGVGLALPATSGEGTAPTPVDYARAVRPIFAKHCYRCHGAKARKGGLRLDLKASALAGGDDGPVIVPGRSAESRLVRYVAGLDEDHVMPPEGSAEPLSDAQVKILRAWIDRGASWPDDVANVREAASDHWAFRRPVRPEPPSVNDVAWPRNPIDRFILARLEKEGLGPSPEADHATLIRRLSLDLIGLPPTIAEVDDFLNDRRPDAYERLVDRLLSSPQYGERWGRHWLDRARYADTNGYEKDRPRSIWPYRDWVIRSINADMPFDRFTVEQVAGDLLPGATADQRVATGFHRNTMINEEGGIDVEEFRFASVVDRVATTGTVWLGLTIQCAQCHTHKFDPITQREYYQLFAFLNNADEPEIDLPDPSIAARRDDLSRKIAAMEAERAARFPVPADEDRPCAIDAKLEAWESRIRPAHWTPITPTRLASKKHATLTVLDDRSVLATGDKPNNDTYEIDLETDLRGLTAIRLEVLPDPSLPDGGPGRAPLFSVGDFILTEIEVSAGATPRPIKLRDASADYAEKGRPASLAIDGVSDTGWTVKGGIGRPHAAVFVFGEDVGGSGMTRLRVTLHQDGIHQMTIGRFRLSVTADPHPVRASGVPAGIEAILATPRAFRSAEEADRLRAYYLSVAPELADWNGRIEAARASLPRFATTMVMRERPAAEARTTHVHRRGEFLKPTIAVEPGVPAVLHPLPPGAPRDRLTLARWLVDESNPLVGRVIMNQVWQAYFGTGIVATAEDFGTRGERPSHPELLDWLATEFVARGWSLKAMHRLIVTSATYRQSSRVSPGLLTRDPKNRLLARGPRFRVEAEVVRDVALSAAGLLCAKVGGPSVFPPQPEGVTALAYGQVAWTTSVGPDRYRRGLYTFTKRTAPYAAFLCFDGPTSETACVRRERSNTPLQALTLLNDAVFVEASQAIARRLLDGPPRPDADRAREAFRLCLARPPSDEELRLLIDFHDRQLSHFRASRADALKVAGIDPKAPPSGLDPDDLAAWTAVARAILNLDETVNKE